MYTWCVSGCLGRHDAMDESGLVTTNLCDKQRESGRIRPDSGVYSHASLRGSYFKASNGFCVSPIVVASVELSFTLLHQVRFNIQTQN